MTKVEIVQTIHGADYDRWLSWDSCIGPWKFPFFSSGLTQSMIDSGFRKPTPLQALLWPILMDRHDASVIATTAPMGKTLAYLLPGFIAVKRAEFYENTEFESGPGMLIVAPTAERCKHIFEECERFRARVPIVTVCMTADPPEIPWCHCLVIEASRLIALLDGHVFKGVGKGKRKKAARLTFENCRFLVLDDFGEMPEQTVAVIQQLTNSMHRELNIAMFSSPFKYNASAASLLLNPHAFSCLQVSSCPLRYQEQIGELEGELAACQARCHQAEQQLVWQMASKLHWPSHYAEFAVEPLESNTPMFNFFAEFLKASCTSHRKQLGQPDFCPPPQLEVLRIEAVSNPRLTKQYLLFLEQLEEIRRETGCAAIPALTGRKLPIHGMAATTDLNEHFLFHGARREIIQEICRDGFDPRRGGESVGRMFGVATYMALNASKADTYTESFDARLPRNAERHVIIARVALGESFRATSPMPTAQRPPDANGRGLDSIWADCRENGGAVDHIEVMAYERGQALPVVIVSYAHAFTCGCAECLKRPVQ